MIITVCVVIYLDRNSKQGGDLNKNEFINISLSYNYTLSKFFIELIVVKESAWVSGFVQCPSLSLPPRKKTLKGLVHDQ